MKQDYYSIFDDGDHVIRLKINRDDAGLVDDCKCDYIQRSADSNIFAESYEAAGLIKFLPEALRAQAALCIAEFDFGPCFSMARRPDSIGYSNDYI